MSEARRHPMQNRRKPSVRGRVELRPQPASGRPRPKRRTESVFAERPSVTVTAVAPAPTPVLSRRYLTYLAIALVILLAAAFLFTRACTPAEDIEQETAIAELEPSNYELIDEAALQDILGAELTAKLITAAADNDDAAWIAAHPEAYAGDGDSVQFKLLRLAANEPNAVSFVRAFPELYPADTAADDRAGESAGRRTPRLYQWDERWGGTVYCSTAFTLTGCCPTSMAMVYQGLTGKDDKGPHEMGQLAQEYGYMDQYNGTSQSYFAGVAPKLGLRCTSLDVSAQALRDALSRNELVICNVGPGDFTDGGHYLVITGMDEDGKLLINDPFSAMKSDESWDMSTMLAQTKALWAFSA